jgi:hypothetical protein
MVAPGRHHGVLCVYDACRKLRRTPCKSITSFSSCGLLWSGSGCSTSSTAKTKSNACAQRALNQWRSASKVCPASACCAGLGAALVFAFTFELALAPLLVFALVLAPACAVADALFTAEAARWLAPTSGYKAFINKLW